MKTFKVVSLKKQHIYSEGELIRKIKTDNILKYYGVDSISELECFTDNNGLLILIKEI